MSPTPEPLAPASPRTPENARTIAGLLAESSITQLTLAAPGQSPSVLASRETDLPALLQSSPVGTTLSCPARSLIIRLDHDTFTLARADEQPESPLLAAWRAAFKPHAPSKDR